MNEPTIEQAITEFTRAYERLYQRWPDELNIVDGLYVVLNSVRLNAVELQHLTSELHREYRQTLPERRETMERLVAWFSQ